MGGFWMVRAGRGFPDANFGNPRPGIVLGIWYDFPGWERGEGFGFVNPRPAQSRDNRGVLAEGTGARFSDKSIF